MSTIASVRSSGASPEIVQNIADASQASGVDFRYLLGQAGVESGFNPTIGAQTSSAKGLYQFTDQTWLATLDRHGDKYGYGWASKAIDQRSDGRYVVSDPALRDKIFGLRLDPQAASYMAAEFASDNRDFMASRIGREPEPVDLYLAHFLGASGGTRFVQAWMANPEQAAAPLFPEAASANRTIFYRSDGSMRSLGQIRSLFSAKLDVASSNAMNDMTAPTGDQSYAANGSAPLPPLLPVQRPLPLNGPYPVDQPPSLLALGDESAPQSIYLPPAAYSPSSVQAYAPQGLASLPPAQASFEPQWSDTTATEPTAPLVAAQKVSTPWTRQTTPQSEHARVSLASFSFVPMPKKLSLEFAQSTYQRISAL